MGYFIPYQERWVNDNSTLKIYEKSRRIGITYATSFRCILKCLEEKKDSSFVQWVSSRDELTAKEFVTDYVAMWAREANKVSRELAAAVDGAVGLDGRNTEVVDEKHGITAFVVRFKNGARICSISSNPLAFAGKGGDILIDEMDLHAEQETLYAMAYPCITWGGQLEIVSAYSADGSENTVFAQLCTEAKGENPKGFSCHRTTLDDAIGEGFVEKVNEVKAAKGRPTQTREEFREQIRKGCITRGAFESQYLCIPNKASGQQAIAPSDLAAAKKPIGVLRIHLVGDATVLDYADPCVLMYAEHEYWRDLAYLGKWERIALGWDIAVTGDLACIWVNVRQPNGVYRLAACLTFKGCKTESQRRVVEAILDADRSAVGAGDASGLGTTECANLEVKYYGRFVGLKFNAQSKLALYTLTQGVYEARRQELPINPPEIAADVAAMKKGTSASEKLIFVATKNDLLPDSHCDLMTGNALAIYAGETVQNTGPCKFEAAGTQKPEATGESAWSRSRRPDHSGDGDGPWRDGKEESNAFF